MIKFTLEINELKNTFANIMKTQLEGHMAQFSMFIN